MADTVLYAVEGGVATITLHRPHAMNALDMTMAEDLVPAVIRAAEEDAVRCVLIRGSGKHFSAGGDVRFFHGTLALDAANRKRVYERILGLVNPTILRLRGMPKPVVVGLRGAVAGFGLSLVCAADLAVAAEDAVFATAFSLIGATPDSGITYGLPRLVGPCKAMELVLLGDRFSAAEAAAMGLVNRVVATDTLEAEVQALAARLARGPTHAYGRAKALLQAASTADLPGQLQAELDSFAAISATADFAEGLTAFIDKRPPRFTGRG